MPEKQQKPLAVTEDEEHRYSLVVMAEKSLETIIGRVRAALSEPAHSEGIAEALMAKFSEKARTAVEEMSRTLTSGMEEVLKNFSSVAEKGIRIDGLDLSQVMDAISTKVIEKMNMTGFADRVSNLVIEKLQIAGAIPSSISLVPMPGATSPGKTTAS